MSTITPKIDFAKELSGMFDLNGKVAFIPGGYGGIGEAIAWGLALSGAKVMIAGRNLENPRCWPLNLQTLGLRPRVSPLTRHQWMTSSVQFRTPWTRLAKLTS
jgi:hypothetical protein